MKIFKLHLRDPNETVIVRAKSDDDAINFVTINIIQPEASEANGISDTPKPLSYRIARCEEEMGSIHSTTGKQEILFRSPK